MRHNNACPVFFVSFRPRVIIGVWQWWMWTAAPTVGWLDLTVAGGFKGFYIHHINQVNSRSELTAYIRNDVPFPVLLVELQIFTMLKLNVIELFFSFINMNE